MFVAATYSPLTIVDRQEFRHPVKLKSIRVMAQMLDEKHDDWVVNIFNELRKSFCLYHRRRLVFTPKIIFGIYILAII